MTYMRHLAFTVMLLLLGGVEGWAEEASQQLRQTQAQEREALEGQYGAQAAPLGQAYSQAYSRYLQKKGPYPATELKKIRELKTSREKARAELSKKHDRERLDLKERLVSKSAGKGSAARETGSASAAPAAAASTSAPGLDASAFPKMIEFKKKGSK